VVGICNNSEPRLPAESRESRTATKLWPDLKTPKPKKFLKTKVLGVCRVFILECLF